MKMKALECLVSIMRCLATWSSEGAGSSKGDVAAAAAAAGSEAAGAGGEGTDSAELELEGVDLEGEEGRGGGATSAPPPADNQTQNFEAKKKKKELREQGIVLFNKKPIKGIKFMCVQPPVHLPLLVSTSNSLSCSSALHSRPSCFIPRPEQIR